MRRNALPLLRPTQAVEFHSDFKRSGFAQSGGHIHCTLFVLLLVGSQLIVGCAIPHDLGTLKTPEGRTPDQFNADTRECIEWAVKFRSAPLSQEERALLGEIETGRFAGEGGRGRTGYSDHYVLCLIKRGYRWVPDFKQL